MRIVASKQTMSLKLELPRDDLVVAMNYGVLRMLSSLVHEPRAANKAQAGGIDKLLSDGHVS